MTKRFDNPETESYLTVAADAFRTSSQAESWLYERPCGQADPARSADVAELFH